ncbi:MAG TPA: DEAD/DEAH box helicase family protein, partial [Jatrophihabitans sp.]|nr:DEAD/DEAH box helicase family protein [Jatrophihabitans sp.]
MTAPEERTIRDLVIPRLHAARWPADRIVREYPITNSRREVVGGRVRRGMPLRADIVLRHPQSGHPISAVEVKKTARSEYDGVTQAKDYGTRLGLPLVYATNGRKIIEIDLRRGTQHEVAAYRSADQLWQNFMAAEEINAQAQTFFSIPYSRELTDSSTGLVKQMRYYQHGAAQAVLRAIARGDRRLLAVLATGSGKSMLAAQISNVLWQSRWPRGPEAPDPRPRILYLADRDVLVADPLVRYFTPIFRSDEVHRIRREPLAHKRIFFALYQALEEIFEQYEPDFFDLVIVDECHRGSAREDAEWRKILEHFAGAVQLGMTATPRVDGEADNLAYFGEPVYTYSLRQGIQDGFLAPFQTIRVPLSSDVDGVHIPDGVLDDEGVEIPEGEYGSTQFERTLILPQRTAAAAQFLSDYLRRTDRRAKTIVFCVNQDHAARFAAAIGNLNADLVAEMPYWAQRITSDEGERGTVLLGQFQDGDSPYPVVVTSSDMLTTGVDVPNVRNLVFFSRVQSTARFKQMLGRGTRLDEERGKEFFTVIDFTGATARFADPSFDGPAIRVIDADIDRVPVSGDDLVMDEPQEVEVREAVAEFIT